MSKRKHSFGERFFSLMITVLCLCAIVLAAAIFIDSRLGGNEDMTIVVNRPTATAVPKGTPEPLTLRIELPATAAPTATSTPAPTPEPTPEAYEFLPVYSRAETDQQIIAITIDDCSHQAHLRTAIQLIHPYGAKLTLFPYGEAVMQKGMGEVLRTCVFNLGYQVENRTWSDALIYRLSSSEMAQEIWSADLAVDYVLEKDYSMHLFRMRSGSGAVDARTHEYLRQLGYDGIVNWTVSGSALDMDSLNQRLHSGYIYQFYSDKESLQKMVTFVQYAHSQGFRCVTVNELLGFEPNTWTEPEGEILARTLPEPAPFTPAAVTHKTGDRAWQVLLIQNRLFELGYLDYAGVDGVYGEGTANALSLFQADNGLLGTGVADPDTQSALFSASTPSKTSAPLSGPTPIPTFEPAS